MTREIACELSDAGPRRCDWPGCGAGGEHRAPHSPHELDRHYWFCREHARAYNAQWDFFAGMSRDEIEAFQHDNATWHRPTWPLGGMRAGPGRPNGTGERPGPDRRTRQALAELQLGAEVGLKDIKSRYKQLAKRYHPDANGGDKRAEDRLKRINEAYEYLLARGGT